MLSRRPARAGARQTTLRSAHTAPRASRGPFHPSKLPAARALPTWSWSGGCTWSQTARATSPGRPMRIGWESPCCPCPLQSATPAKTPAAAPARARAWPCASTFRPGGRRRRSTWCRGAASPRWRGPFTRRPSRSFSTSRRRGRLSAKRPHRRRTRRTATAPSPAPCHPTRSLGPYSATSPSTAIPTSRRPAARPWPMSPGTATGHWSPGSLRSRGRPQVSTTPWTSSSKSFRTRTSPLAPFELQGASLA
mmetsp:Transcript_48157/g.148927  ORF Transcript_48157/g.148927 Transcript_48157/m.148927 type:complete len:250 (+) Transcript_48157:213-962(+)